MEIVKRRIKVPRGCSDVSVILSGCCHVGHGSANEPAMHEMVKYIAAEPNRRLILMGDVTDSISVSDPRWSPLEVASWLKTEDLSNRIVLEAERAIQIFSPIKDRIDGIVIGNHENKPKRMVQVDIHRMLCNGLNAPSIGLMGFLQYTFVGRDRGEAKPLTMYLEHGSGGAGTVGVIMNKMVKKAKDFTGVQIAAGAHHHRNGAVTAETIHYDAATGELKREAVLCVTVGSFLEYHTPNRTNYAEMFGLSPHGIGPGKVTLRPWAKRDDDRVGYAFPYWS